MKATLNGNLNPVPDCTIEIPGAGKNRSVGIVQFNNLPDISDSKGAIYNNETIIGRSFPMYTYSHSGDRQISMQMHFFIINQGDGERNLNYLRMVQSALYPRNGNSSGVPYLPPPVCKMRCGNLLATEPLCVILQNYSVKFPTEVAWDEITYCPYRFDIDTNWLVVYDSGDLPYQDRIINSGR